MAKKQQQSIELDYEQKRMANLFGKNLTEADGVRRFLAEGCRAANKDGGVSDAEFWRGLFLESKVSGKYGNNLLRPSKHDGYPNKVPSDPYSSIDYQCTLKYLAHGHERVFDTDKPNVHPIDSENFFRYFNLMDNTESYTSNLKTAIHLRNKYSHDTIEGIQNITADRIFSCWSALPYRCAKEKIFRLRTKFARTGNASKKSTAGNSVRRRSTLTTLPAWYSARTS